MQYQYSENDAIKFEVDGQVVEGTVLGHGDALDEKYTVDIHDLDLPTGRYDDGAVLIEEGVAFVAESATR